MTDILFNIEAIVLYIILLNIDREHIMETHIKFIWINALQLVFSVTAFSLSWFVKRGILRHI